MLRSISKKVNTLDKEIKTKLNCLTIFAKSSVQFNMSKRFTFLVSLSVISLQIDFVLYSPTNSNDVLLWRKRVLHT